MICYDVEDDQMIVDEMKDCEYIEKVMSMDPGGCEKSDYVFFKNGTVLEIVEGLMWLFNSWQDVLDRQTNGIPYIQGSKGGNNESVDM